MEVNKETRKNRKRKEGGRTTKQRNEKARSRTTRLKEDRDATQKEDKETYERRRRVGAARKARRAVK